MQEPFWRSSNKPLVKTKRHGASLIVLRAAGTRLAWTLADEIILLLSFSSDRFLNMELITVLNRCHHFRGFVYHRAAFSPDHKSIEVSVRPRKGSAAVCSRCHLPATGYDQLAERRFEFIPLWGFFVFLLYAMRRVDCRRCGMVAVEEVPWGEGKRTLTKAYMLFLARWARRLS